MPDPSVEAALKEAYASAPSDDVIIHTLELRQRLLVDDGALDSIWVTTIDFCATGLRPPRHAYRPTRWAAVK
jgi:hypothetical protein